MTSGTNQGEPEGALAGVRVLDLCERIGGAYAGQLLATYGADVLLVEPEEGNPLRHRSPFVTGSEDREESLAHLWYQRGKRSVVIDFRSEGKCSKLQQLVEGADIVLESFAPGRRAELGLSFETLQGWKRDIILVSVTDFGQSGPYRDFQAEEITLEALAGQMYGTGSPEREPLCAGPPISQMTGGLHAVLGSLMALRLRDRDGKARHVDVAHLEAGLENMELRAFKFWRKGLTPTRKDLAHSPVVPWGAYPCRDGWAALLGAPFRRWGTFADLLPGGDFLTRLYARAIARMEQASSVEPDSLASGPVARVKRLIQRYIDAASGSWAKKRTRGEIMQVARERGLAFGELRTLGEVLRLAQHKERGFFTELDHPVTGKLSYSGALFPARGVRLERAPLLGEHAGWREEAKPPRAGRATSPGKAGNGFPMEGVRILDLTIVEAAPHGSRVLADFGADVIKVEYESRLDVFRGTSLNPDSFNRQALWAQLNRNKRSVTLDLKQEIDRELFLKLVESADVVLSNFRSGTLERLGIGYPELRERRPDLILVTMSAYGDGGPDSDLPAYGGVIEVMSGVQNLTAYSGGKPERIREIDVLNGVAGAMAVLVALKDRDRTGRGQHVDLSQMETTTHALMGVSLLEKAAGLTPAPPGGNSHPEHVPYGCFPCQGDDRWVTLAVRSPGEWRALARVMGREDWSKDGELATADGRRKRKEELDSQISAWTCRREDRAVMTECQAAGVACAAVLPLHEVVEDPHLRERSWFRGRPGEEDFFMGVPFSISGIEVEAPRSGPDLGEGNEEILSGLDESRPGGHREVDSSRLGSAFRLDPG